MEEMESKVNSMDEKVDQAVQSVALVNERVDHVEDRVEEQGTCFYLISFYIYILLN